MADLLNVQPIEIEQKITGRELLGIRREESWVLHPFQFEGAKPIPGLEQVLRAMPDDMMAFSIVWWMTQWNLDLDVDPDSYHCAFIA